MKKKIMALTLAVIFIVSASVSAFATSEFDTSVFDNAEDITVKYDDMTDMTVISCSSLSTSLLKGRTAVVDVNLATVVTISPTLVLSNSMDAYIFYFYYVSNSWLFINSMIVKIGDHRYTFSDFGTSRQTRKNGEIQESFHIFMNSDIAAMMQDLIEHRDEEIKVRLSGSKGHVDFALTEDIKDGMIRLYDLYAEGGGTRQSNMDMIAEQAPVTLSVQE